MNMKVKYIASLLLFSLFNSIVMAQYDQFHKLEELYEAGEYQNCIDKAEKYSEKDKKQALPYYYSALSYFEMAKAAPDEKERSKNLKKALSTLKMAQTKDKKSVFESQFGHTIDELQIETRTFASTLYQKDKEDSKPFYNYLVTVFSDTTQQYRELYGLIDIKTTTDVGIDLEAKAKIGPNITDANGLKQGLWRKIYPNGEIAYEARFKDDIPEGTVRRYHDNGKLQAELTYNQAGVDYAQASIFSPEGILVAEGFYNGTKKDSTWRYYSDDRNLAEAEATEKKLSVTSGKLHYLISEENFKNGIKNGKDIKYFPSGNMSQLVTWKMGILHGPSKEFFTNGKVKVEFYNREDKRTGAYNQYFTSGRPEILGYYLSGHKHGKWVYYTSTGEVESETYYLYGEAKNQNELDERETNILKEFEKNKGQLDDPENYRNDPDAFLRKF